MSEIGLFLLTTTTIASYARSLDSRVAFSASFKPRDDKPISALPSLTAAIPAPEPVGLYVTSMPLPSNDSI